MRSLSLPLLLPAARGSTWLCDDVVNDLLASARRRRGNDDIRLNGGRLGRNGSISISHGHPQPQDLCMSGEV